MNEESRMALGKINHLMIGGEALPGSLFDEFRQITDATVENMYGPTETTIWSTTESVNTTQGLVNIGAPIANTQVYVLDTKGAPCPVGVAGELFIGGDGVTRGYLNRDEMTAERFVENPFHGQRMYRTGDLVRWRADGKLDFLGRIDHQVKLRGYRIELGEIERQLEQQPSVQQAVVVTREDSPGDVRLVAYLIAQDAYDEGAVKNNLANVLPEFMVPAQFVLLNEFPLTPNKKVDRNALPAPKLAMDSIQVSDENLHQQDTVEAKISGIWKRVLGVERIGAKDSFFDLGGHSLLAVQAHREIREKCNVSKLAITDVFRFPTLNALAQRVRELTGEIETKRAKVVEAAGTATAETETLSRRREMRAKRRMARI